VEKEKAERVKRNLQQITPDILRMLRSAPEYGSCGIILTFHGGNIVKVGKHLEETKLGEKNEKK